MILQQTKPTVFLFDGKQYQTEMSLQRVDGFYECRIKYNNREYSCKDVSELEARKTAIHHLEFGIREEIERHKFMPKDMEEQLEIIWKGLKWEEVT